MKRAALLVLALAAALVVIPGTAAFACSCAGLPVADEVARADLVVVGVVGAAVGAGQTVTRPVTVTRTLKGVAGPRLDVSSARDGASCGLEVELGREYVVFAAERGGTMTADLCGGTAPADEEHLRQVEAVTGPGQVVRAEPATAPARAMAHTPVDAPPADPADPWLPAGTAAAVAAIVVTTLGVLGVVLARRRRT
ncbi:hypothetical protein ABEG17_01325 [Pedococcus sp. KACC 23699]|uniref:Tissue inhibitor of metalloproteinase n=1 Tax=Pedococcus sp. KACC 23699 TaxID=3149228 RepID=A0AAU7JV59_9MICO